MCTSQRHYKCNSRIELYCGQTQTGVQKYCIHGRPQRGGGKSRRAPPAIVEDSQNVLLLFLHVGPFTTSFSLCGALLLLLSPCGGLFANMWRCFQSCGDWGPFRYFFIHVMGPFCLYGGPFWGLPAPTKISAGAHVYIA